MNIRHKARELALQILYRTDIAGAAENLDSELESLAPGTQARIYCETLIKGVADKRQELDSLIEEFSENWTVDRMAIVDRNILRIAAYELKHSPDVPFKVIIDEAVELAKKYSAEDSGAFINGVLDKIRKGLEAKRGSKSAGA